MSFTAVMAIFAAAVSMLALAWQIYSWLRKIQAKYDRDGQPLSRVDCTYKIVNAGGHPARVTEIWAGQVSTTDVLEAVSTRRDAEGIGRPLLLEPGECKVWRFSVAKGSAIRCCDRALGRVYVFAIHPRATL